MWPGPVGKGPNSQPPLALDAMLEITANARVDGVGFDGIDLFLADPHISIHSTPDDINRLADRVAGHGLAVGSLVAPLWPPLGGGSAMGSPEQRKRFVTMVEKACQIGWQLRDIGIRPSGVVRIDSAASVVEWATDPPGNQKTIAQTVAQACAVAESYGERLAAQGEISSGGMHSWKYMVQLLEMVGRPETLGFQANMAHTLLYTLGYNAPEHRLLPDDYDWSDRAIFDEALRTVADALRPWTIDFNVAQSDATLNGGGSHGKTGRHGMAADTDGKLDIVRHAGFWLRDNDGRLTRVCTHICWDGCQFPISEMTKQQTWNEILAVMIRVREAHGWAQ
jgi:hypothetical protein